MKECTDLKIVELKNGDVEVWAIEKLPQMQIDKEREALKKGIQSFRSLLRWNGADEVDFSKPCTERIYIFRRHCGAWIKIEMFFGEGDYKLYVETRRDADAQDLGIRKIVTYPYIA